ncbi:MAG: hypothetical protein V1743_01290 [Nanoarchaeota archaeon]
MPSLLNIFRQRKPLPTLDTLLQEYSSTQSIRKYLGILDTYGVSWTLEKAARDTLQNFFDGNNHTLDGVSVNISQEGSKEYVIRIQNHATYDFRRLLHLGGTTKENEEFSAGGIGEGAKVLALVLLRDYKFSQVRFASEDWTVDFTLEEMPEGEYVERRKGLYATVTHTPEKLAGNLIEFRTNDRKKAQAFTDAKNLFYHSENPDFQQPTLDNPNIGGFKFLGNSNGNLYVAGQRRHMDREAWNTLEYVSVWISSNTALRKDRDRGLVTRQELIDLVIPKLVEKTPSGELERVLYALEPIWTETSGFEKKIGPKIMEKTIQTLERNGKKMQFDDKYVAFSISCIGTIEDSMQAQGYIVCNHSFSQIGMKTVAEKYAQMAAHQRLDPTPKEEKRMQILYEAAKAVDKGKKDIWIFGQEQEKSILRGNYCSTYVWMSREDMKLPFNKALSTYLHELDHVHGHDYSRDFSQALTSTIDDIVRVSSDQPELFRTLRQRWENA